MEQTAWVHKLGADKYGAWNWRETGVCASTYVNAILRHLNAWRDGEDLDPESGISHLAHIACSCNILLDADYCDTLQDDRNTAPIGKGAIPYGDHDAWIQTHEDNGKCGMASVLFNLMGEDRGADRSPSWADSPIHDELMAAGVDPVSGIAHDPEPEEGCECGRRRIYHWLYGWVCEDCDLQHQDPYDQ
jgi:hypothetical protein